jgi:hypothetical protein
MIKDIGLWLKSAIECLFEQVVEGTKTKKVFADGVTQDFLVEFFNYTCTEKEWFQLSENSRKSLIGGELRRLQLKKKIEEKKDDEFITKRKVYVPVTE